MQEKRYFWQEQWNKQESWCESFASNDPPSNSHDDQNKDDSSNVDEKTDGKSNNENSDPTVTPNGKSDESRSEANKNENDSTGSRTDNTPKMPSDDPNNTYTVPMNNVEEEKQRRIEEEKKRKLEEERRQQEQKDKKNVEELKKIIEEQKDAFGSFHTQKEFVDQINVYAKDKKINGLTLQNKDDENKPLNEDTEGGKNNKIKLQLGSQKFETQLGIVLKDAVLTKYYFDDGTENPEIKSNFLNNKRGIEKNWTPVNNTGKSVVITQLGYFKDRGTIKLTGSPHNTSKVPSKLPLKVDSLYLSFYNLKSSKIDNIGNWDTSNIKNAEQAFYYAQNFNQDLSRWKVTNINNMKQMFSNAKSYSYSLDGWKIKSGVNTNKIFENAPKMKQHFEKIASAWSIDKSKLS